ncbi:alanine racemase [Mesorhizobium sp. LHD-90]|uniref:alanine racemase n=1 Tax=Mesorhizobium sp. LHD-90 TaxID=3071414 RepID=UPI0027DEB699|nr:alanine racemase [Mesorhizobium sp. LHD-90]MDQ6432497.1 alanine racemase [Mesorhizobium sp. LHD-90]
MLKRDDHAGSAAGAATLDPGLVQAGAVLTIDLGAIRANYRLLRDRQGGGRCAAVVKADAYGLGAEKVAPALVREGCDRFFVALLGEGLALRKILGANPEIFVLNGLPPGAEAFCAAAGLIPVLNSEAQLFAWRALAAKQERTLPAAVQVDSGMARLGMPPYEVDRIAADPHAFDRIDLKLVMSHFARADEPGEASNAAQRRAFAALAEKLPAAPRSLANSSGIFLNRDDIADFARPGCALYGINPQPGLPNPMRPVVRLDAKVIQTREVPAGTGIGYGHAAKATVPMRLATISLGYADGWHRRAASYAFLAGKRLPFVGRVSMDSIILDVTALPPGLPEPGALVELIGPHQSVDEVAAQAGTIGYEVLTSFGSRFHRVYLGIDEGEATARLQTR